jgi:predicted lipid-binding transport protein (Tim44 family)
MSLVAKVAAGGILAVIGLMVLKMMFGLAGVIASFLALAFKIALVAFVIWLAARLFRRPRGEPA